MTTRLRIMGLCVSLLVFLALPGLLDPIAVAGLIPRGECPCDFGAVLKSNPCWVDPFPIPDIPLRFTPFEEQFKGCRLRVSRTDPQTPPLIFFEVGIGTTFEGMFCSRDVRGDFPPACDPPPLAQAPNLTTDQFQACQCELQAYARMLNDAGISVLGGPPYICSDIECAPPIPTLNQYGMIIMAAVLGLFAVIGLFVMRRGNEVKPSS